MINTIPVVKGVVHNLCGDDEGAKEAYLASTRTAAVMAAGAGGFVLGGPLGAATVGLEAGAVWSSLPPKEPTV